MTKLCECGCGEPTLLAKYTDARYGIFKGQPTRFLNHHAPRLRARTVGMSGKPPAERFWEHVDKTDDCWVWNGYRDKHGYGLFIPQYNRKNGRTGRIVRAHRFSWFLAHGEQPADELMVCHHCDNPPCVNPAHLFLGTARDNNLDRKLKGRFPPSEQHWTRREPERQAGECGANAKLTNQQAGELLERYRAGGISLQKIATQYGVSKGSVQKLIERKTWKILGP